MSTCLERACETLGQNMPFNRSGGARRLFKNASSFGRVLADNEDPIPGDIVCWSRGTSAWMGHIALVERFADGVIHTIEGNVGPYPSKVKRLKHPRNASNLIGIARY